MSADGASSGRITAVVLVEGCSEEKRDKGGAGGAGALDGGADEDAGGGGVAAAAGSMGSGSLGGLGGGSEDAHGADDEEAGAPGWSGGGAVPSSSGDPIFDAFTASCGSRCLVPVGNMCALGYTLRRLEGAGMRRAYVAVQGEHQARTVSNWIRDNTRYTLAGAAGPGDAAVSGIAKAPADAGPGPPDAAAAAGASKAEAAGADAPGPAPMDVEVVAVNEHVGSADALREITKKKGLALRSRSGGANDILVVQANLIHDVNLQLVAAAHRFNGALATVVVSPKSRGGKAGDGNKGGGKVLKRNDYLDKISGDIVGLGEDSAHMVFFAPSEDWRKAREITLRKSLVRLCERITLRTDLTDAGIYFFSPRAMEILDESAGVHSIRDHLLPNLARGQFRTRGARGLRGRPSDAALFKSQSGSMSYGDLRSGGYGTDSSNNNLPATPKAGGPEGGGGLGDDDDFPFDSPAAAGGLGRQCFVYDADDSYCFQVNSMEALAEANRDVAGQEAFHLTGLSLSRYDNAVDASVTIGSNKSVIGPQCIVGAQSTLGDKCSVKKSVVGAGCKLGNGVKITSSLLFDACVVEDGSSLQNCTLGRGVWVKSKCTLKDCQLGPGVVVESGEDWRGEEQLANP